MDGSLSTFGVPSEIWSLIFSSSQCTWYPITTSILESLSNDPCPLQSIALLNSLNKMLSLEFSEGVSHNYQVQQASLRWTRYIYVHYPAVLQTCERSRSTSSNRAASCIRPAIYTHHPPQNKLSMYQMPKATKTNLNSPQLRRTSREMVQLFSIEFVSNADFNFGQNIQYVKFCNCHTENTTQITLLEDGNLLTYTRFTLIQSENILET